MAEATYKQTISLPMFQGTADEDVEEITDKLKMLFLIVRSGELLYAK